MNTGARIIAPLIVGFLVWAGSANPAAALLCSQMGPGIPNNKFVGKWHLGFHDTIVCQIQITNRGVILPSSTCSRGGTAGTITGAIVVSNNCKATGSFHIILPSPQNFNQTYTVNASMAESVNQSASIILGDGIYTPSLPIYFWMIQTP